MRLSRCEVRDHINYRKNDCWRSYRFYRALQRLKSPIRYICEIFGAPRFSSFSTLSRKERTSIIRGLSSAFDPVDGAHSAASRCHRVVGLDRANHIDPTETCRESYCLLASTWVQGCSWGEIDLAQDSRDKPGIPIPNGSVSRRSIPICGVLLAGARRCVSR